MKKLNVARTFKEHGLKAKDVAERLGISSMAISARINNNPTISSLEEIAKAVGCDITDFFYPDTTEGDSAADAPQDGLFAQQEEHGQQDDAKAEGEAQAQDAREMMYCPHCGTKFFVVNVPVNAANG